MVLHELPALRKIGGKVYILAATRGYKRRINIIAKEKQKEGYSIRIIPYKQGVSSGYALYVRYKPTRKRRRSRG